ncbi:hypothetical protein BDV95DRAFT_94880 [Massariosphaeria phaeospora]|uniref:Uncharacterized protein n=1 Tax=Massariosphaeria phaeospora TaxID=100035 RepID=A0A7C8I2M9_9PLEO|nr:hypothetical protein BDV95DRAFT_94880 [Massariosphaeria phaeospora]
MPSHRRHVIARPPSRSVTPTPHVHHPQHQAKPSPVLNTCPLAHPCPLVSTRRCQDASVGSGRPISGNLRLAGADWTALAAAGPVTLCRLLHHHITLPCHQTSSGPGSACHAARPGTLSAALGRPSLLTHTRGGPSFVSVPDSIGGMEMLHCCVDADDGAEARLLETQIGAGSKESDFAHIATFRLRLVDRLQDGLVVDIFPPSPHGCQRHGPDGSDTSPSTSLFRTVPVFLSLHSPTSKRVKLYITTEHVLTISPPAHRIWKDKYNPKP